jgi:hypothetical protein
MSQMGQLRDIVATFAPNTAAEMDEKADKKAADENPTDPAPIDDVDTSDEIEDVEDVEDVDGEVHDGEDEPADTRSSS